MHNNALIYDIEIIKAVPDKKMPKIEGLEYCAGWHDHANMGISVIGAYDYAENRYRVFCKDNFDEFAKLLAVRRPLVTFNGLNFDNRVIDAVMKIGYEPDEGDYDILVEMWRAAGLGPQFKFPTHVGFSLDAVCKVNFGTEKSGSGGKAPIDWQAGRIGTVIDYCLNDVKLTKQLYDIILMTGLLLDPRNGQSKLIMRMPEVIKP